MKLIIQIPCLNEADTIAITLDALPKTMPGFDKVEWLIIDDGSTDKTQEVARQHGVDHVVAHTHNQGLAKGFMTGINACLELGADVIVNTDADNQYNADDISKLVEPIIQQKADIVIGARPINQIGHFSFIKKKLQNFGSYIVRKLSGTNVPDAPSGFRAFSKKAAMQLNVISDYTYTLETIIQAGRKNMAVCSVPIRVNEDLRPSRLFKSIPSYIQRSIVTIIRIFVVYKPFRFFMTIGLILFIMGFLLGLRFLFYYFFGEGHGHIQSVILSSILLILGFQTALVAFITDLLAANRKLIEDVQLQMKKIKYN